MSKKVIYVGVNAITPSSIPRQNKSQIKTDSIDASNIAHFFANGMLTIIKAPDAEIEKDRVLSRSRQFLLSQLTEIRLYALLPRIQSSPDECASFFLPIF